MKKIIILLLFFCFQHQVAFCQTTYWQQKVDYKINVTLNDVDQTLDGNVSMIYFNNSPDTLPFIWIHLYANAYKNDRTAFSEQLLKNNRTDFYFSNNEDRGYINRLNFTANGSTAKIVADSLNQDVIKLILPQPILPNSNIKIETSFHIKLPTNFCGNGHIKRAYQITQWYPKPAVYDSKGWHQMPYLTESDTYSEYGDFEVIITLPKNYVVASNGVLKTETEKNWLVNRKNPTALIKKKIATKQSMIFTKKKNIATQNIADKIITTETKSITFYQTNCTNFVWFADKKFIVQKDTVELNTGKIITINSYHLPSINTYWSNNISLIKKAILARNNLPSEYPYNTINVVESAAALDNNNKYAGLINISTVKNEQELSSKINKKIGENWFFGLVENNNYDHLWMRNGINKFYNNTLDKKLIDTHHFGKNKYSTKNSSQNFDSIIVETIVQQKKDQPIETATNKFSQSNYYIIADLKAGEWMKKLEQDLGKQLFDSCMREYYRRWQFKHPYPTDFKNTIETVSGKNMDSTFLLLTKKGELENQKTTTHFKLKVLPAIGYNNYDNVMIGAAITNCTLPHPKLQFILTPLYATGSKQLNGIGQIKYSWYPNKIFQKIELGVNGARFATQKSIDTNSNKIFENFYKIVPSLRLYFNHSVTSTLVSYLDLRTYFIGEKNYNTFASTTNLNGADIIYPVSTEQDTRHLNQLTFNVANSRILYPYDCQLQLQQGANFYRLNLTTNYFFNYAKGGGLNIRLFAAKFGYIGGVNYLSDQYKPKLLAGNGNDDYTYNSYFLGRSATYAREGTPISNNGIATQQLLIKNTGGLKFRLDGYTQLQGQSENWIAALNLATSLPNGLFPFKLPIKIFLDIGTYKEAWDANSPTSKILYTGGLQVSLFKDVLHIYAPLIYSSDFNSALKGDTHLNSFVKRISFSIDLQNIKAKNFIPKMPYQIVVE